MKFRDVRCPCAEVADLNVLLKFVQSADSCFPREVSPRWQKAESRHTKRLQAQGETYHIQVMYSHFPKVVVRHILLICVTAVAFAMADENPVTNFAQISVSDELLHRSNVSTETVILAC